MQLSVTYPDKYDDDMFYIAPFYHRIFPQISRCCEALSSLTVLHMNMN